MTITNNVIAREEAKVIIFPYTLSTPPEAISGMIEEIASANLMVIPRG
ncbi:MAG: hypothetical protein AB4080_10590 [Trichodesmium sp.]